VTLCEGGHIGVADLQLPAAVPVIGGGSSNSGDPDAALDEHIEEVEKRAIEEALKKARYNKTRAAQLLGMSFRSLRYRIKKLNIES
jgi:two-component system, NtrC family, response regulator PilR